MTVSGEIRNNKIYVWDTAAPQGALAGVVMNQDDTLSVRGTLELRDFTDKQGDFDALAASGRAEGRLGKETSKVHLIRADMDAPQPLATYLEANEKGMTPDLVQNLYIRLKQVNTEVEATADTAQVAVPSAAAKAAQFNQIMARLPQAVAMREKPLVLRTQIYSNNSFAMWDPLATGLAGFVIKRMSGGFNYITEELILKQLGGEELKALEKKGLIVAKGKTGFCVVRNPITPDRELVTYCQRPEKIEFISSELSRGAELLTVYPGASVQQLTSWLEGRVPVGQSEQPEKKPRASLLKKLFGGGFGGKPPGEADQGQGRY